MQTYISSVQKQFRYYKKLADSACIQLSDEEIFSQLHRSKESIQTNSIAVIIQHLAGNMLSRWSNIWEEDGEKDWRNRDQEFVSPKFDRIELLEYWEKGWACLFEVVDSLDIVDLERMVYIRNMGHSLVEAMNRQLMHYAYHIGQIVLLAKEWKGDDWSSLSIPLGESPKYNKEKFAKAKRMQHFSDEWVSEDEAQGPTKP